MAAPAWGGIAAGLAAFGADVAIWERDADTCASAADAVGGLPVVTDVRESDQVDRAVAATLERYGRIDVLVNNAGGVFVSSILDVAEKGIDALYRANLRHVILCTQRGHGVRRERRQHRQRRVDRGVRAAPGYAAYAAAKAGVLNFTKTAALELAPHGIRVNALAPDIAWTEGLAKLAAAAGTTRPSGRPGRRSWSRSGASATWTTWRGRCSSPPACPPTSPARRSTSTGHLRRRRLVPPPGTGDYVLGAP